MQFFLDQNVDADVRSMLISRGHDAWSADQANLGQDVDDELTAYAHEHQAVLVTHDREFSQRRRNNVIGRHVWLACDELDAPEIFGKYLDDTVAVLERNEHAFARVSRDALAFSFGWS